MRSMRPQFQRLDALALPRRSLAHTRRLVHSSSRRDVSALTSSPNLVSSPPATTPKNAAPSKSSPLTLSRLPTASVLRSYMIMRMSSSPALLSVCFSILRRMLNSKSQFMSIERNPAIRKLLKGTFYKQFCAGETKEEVQLNTTAARELLGYDGIMLEYALEVLKGGARPTAEEIEREIEAWKKGILASIDVAKEGDFIGMKWSGLGREALRLLQAGLPPSASMYSAITSACDAAAAKNVVLLPGAEEEATNPGLDKWTLELSKKYNTPERGRAIVYVTYQCYLKGIGQRLSAHLALAQRENFIAGLKLVRGAYLSSEPRSLICDTKADTDSNYDSCASAALTRTYNAVVPPAAPDTPFPAVNIILATHNLASVHKAQAIREQQLLTHAPEALPKLAFAQLQGMADEISQQLVQDARDKADTQARVVKCMTWGTTTECLNFLLRRASENKEAAMRTEDTRRAMGRELGRRVRGVFGFA
ncbi:carbapenem antibiotics biosynthesis protein card, partial [Polyplosphaeria fusca]